MIPCMWEDDEEWRLQNYNVIILKLLLSLWDYVNYGLRASMTFLRSFSNQIKEFIHVPRNFI